MRFVQHAGDDMAFQKMKDFGISIWLPRLHGSILMRLAGLRHRECAGQVSLHPSQVRL
jgi:hypothetical protein